MITLQILFSLAIIKYMKFLTKGQSKFGSSLLLPAYGREGQGQHLLAACQLRWREIRRRRKSEGGASEQQNASEFSKCLD